MKTKKGKFCLDWICPLRKPNNKIVFNIIDGKKPKDVNLYCTSIDCKKPLSKVRGILKKGYKEFDRELHKVIKEEK